MIAAVAGTFNILHSGHRRLIEHAFSIADEVYVGISSDAMASSGREKVLPLYLRSAALTSYLDTLGRYRLFVIEDMYGPDEMMDNVDVLVVSEETASNGRAVNDRRVSRGLGVLLKRESIEFDPHRITDFDFTDILRRDLRFHLDLADRHERDQRFRLTHRRTDRE